jgi:Ran GTPase-activating protein (RanGAP) involved in mRNA processing and transport
VLSLNLSTNMLGDKGAEHIADALKWNRTLLTLNLTNNKIGDVGVAKIATALTEFPLTHEQVTRAISIQFNNLLASFTFKSN